MRTLPARILGDDLSSIFVRNGFVPVRCRHFGDDQALRECDGPSAIVADRFGYDKAWGEWHAFRAAEEPGELSSRLHRIYVARTSDIGLSLVYVIAFGKGWDGTNKPAFADPAEQREAELAYRDGLFQWEHVNAAIDAAKLVEQHDYGPPDGSPQELV
jgi:hypothetical protein